LFNDASTNLYLSWLVIGSILLIAEIFFGLGYISIRVFAAGAEKMASGFQFFMFTIIRL
jgi:membrane protein implicated in regulation of membrane protease activity